jgi:glycosyltransferase involved in cell wall biosynthesis
MAKAPLISVILLCYNHERYVEEAVDGLLTQTYAPLDVIIVDDCSTDRSAELIESMLAKRGQPSNIRFVQTSRNMVHPIPAVINSVKGSFIIIASTDDIMLPTMIEDMVAVWYEKDVSLVTTNALYIDESSNLIGRTFRDLNIPPDDSFETLARDGSNACCFGAAMGFDRVILETFGWPPTEFLGASDLILPFYAYLLKGAIFLNKPLLKYRVHSGNSSGSLLVERSVGENRLLELERVFGNHLAHAVFFQEELDRLRSESSERYGEVADRMLPLVGIQLAEMAKKLVRNRRELAALRRRESSVGK